ncbi:retron St85 family RNA-directed DNA polymerase [Paenibacillus sp. CMAA1364]
MESNYLDELKQELCDNGFDDAYIRLCLDYSERLIANRLPVIFDKIHLSMLFGMEVKEITVLVKSIENEYTIKNIPKKSGETRELYIPSPKLKEIQRWILDEILYNIKVSPHCTGFVKEKSILENARLHENKACVMNLDIRNFFPSIRFEAIYRVFYYHGYTSEVSYYLARLCTVHSFLPQGAPTSPYLSNIVCLRLDKRLSSLVSKYDANYSRYADDITLSGRSSNIVPRLPLIRKILDSEGFEINYKKVRVQKQQERQMVTGLVVNNKARVPKEVERKLRQQIYYCNKFGVYEHLKRTKKNKLSGFKEHLYGLAMFIKMIDSRKGEKYVSDLNEIPWDY